jgi:hypothetical protein
MSRRQNKRTEQTMLWTTASPGSLRSVAIGLAVLIAVLFLAFPCPPWSLKLVIAQSAQCQANLKLIAQALRDRGIPWDESHADQIRGLLDELNLECPEGSEIRGRPAHYILMLKEGSCFITENRGNHPARKRFMAGSVDEKCFGIDAQAKIFHFPQ